MLKRRQDESAAGGSGGNGQLDRVTGLPGRGALEPWLQECLTRSRATSERTGLLFVDVGHLRDVNDSFGPDVGDALLRAVAERLGAEIGGGQRLLRYAGAQFALIAPGVETVGTATSLAEGIFELMAQPFVIDGNTIAVACSVGAGLSDPGYESVRHWIEDANDAVGEARELGHRAVVVRDESTRNRIDLKLTEDRIQKAIADQEFRLLYQPIVTTQNGRVVGFEALLRWLDPGVSGAFIAPNQFLPMLEKTGHIVEIGQWVLDEATRQVQSWNSASAGREPYFVTVNLGARQLAQTHFSHTVARALDASGLKPEHLTLDITPEALQYNRQGTWAELRDLKMLGVKLALDDFGLGASTIEYLREMKVDLLRIHRTFVGGLGTTAEDDAIVKHLVGLGLDLGILSLAEGVESAEQAQRLNELNCGLAQGFYYGRPELPAEIEARMAG
jgi:diguanylate cyclase (GGDEF)-like protein